MPHLNPVAEPQPAPAAVIAQRWVRVLSRRANGFVEFEFSIGWRELAVELVLSEADFQAFCKTHSVQPSEY